MVDFLYGVSGKLKTLLDRWTAAKAGYLDASITSRATAAALTTVDSEVGLILQDTAVMQPKVDSILGDTADMQPLISSMSQYGTTVRNVVNGRLTYAPPASVDYLDVTVGTLADYTKAFVTILQVNNSVDASTTSYYAYPISATAVRVYPNKAGEMYAGRTYDINVSVVEFY